ncbi:hypothetical protein DWW90_02775 [Parabacteroides sp. AF17-28]|nr:hypothetical protein DWW90_02775 [Parabacteroides sp. AF17-28]
MDLYKKIVSGHEYIGHIRYRLYNERPILISLLKLITVCVISKMKRFMLIQLLLSILVYSLVTIKIEWNEKACINIGFDDVTFGHGIKSSVCIGRLWLG